MKNDTKLLIYVIDDDPGDVELLRRHLEDVTSWDLEIEDFVSPEQCFVRLADKTADLVFTDYQLGVMNGIECLNEIRKRGYDCPVIILTGQGDEEIAAKSMRAGASDYIPKSSLTSQVLNKAIQNVVEKHKLRRELEDQRQLLQTSNSDLLKKNEKLKMLTSAMNAASDQIIITDLSGNIVFTNLAFEEETGYNRVEVIGKNISIMKSGIHDQDFYSRLWQTILSGRTWRSEMTNRYKDGSIWIEDVTITPVRNDAEEIAHFIAIKRNITEKKLYENQLDYLAHHDVLTGLPNRLLFSHKLTEHIEDAQSSDKSIAIMFIDLDRFKLINDTQGHNVGDALLSQCSDRLRLCVREGDTLARMGGDEFTVVLNNMSSHDESRSVAERILNTLAKPFALNGREFYISASIGISVYPSDGDSVETLVRNADTAMYRAKEKGRNTYQLYTDALNQEARERVDLEHRLRKALDHNEFLVYYQPQVDLSTGRIIGTEALVRWASPEIGLVSPGDFIPIAEETGLIMPLGRFVLETACAQNKAWQDAGYPAMTVSVNISPNQFQEENIVENLKAVVSKTGLDPRYLDLELTESVLMRNPDEMIKALQQLKDMKIGISIDDFGTGYSSLSYLKQFPVNALKIDRSFVRDITGNPDDAAICRAVIAMAHSLNLKVIAEGVETLAQLEFLRSLKCDEMQGYFVSPPVPAEEIEDLLRQEYGKEAA